MAEPINSRNYRIINGYPAAVEHMKPGLFITITQTSPSKACPDLANRAIRDCLAGMQYKALMTADSAHLEGLKLHSNANVALPRYRLLGMTMATDGATSRMTERKRESSAADQLCQQALFQP